MLKIVADKDVRSLGSQKEGEEGEDMGAPVTTFGKEKAQPTGSSHLAFAPSSTVAMLGVGIQVQRT